MNAANIENISEFYKSLNSTEVLRAQGMIEGAPQVIEDKLSYDMSAESIKAANDAIKHIEINRKFVTIPLDAYKKSIMDIEREYIAPLKAYIEQRKQMMISYSNELAAKKAQADAKIAQDAADALKSAVTSDVSGIFATFTDATTTTTLELDHTKNIRISKKAEIVAEVDWATLLWTLMQAEMFDVQELLRKLPKAMEITNMTEIRGIELTEVKTQVIR
jgi:flagellar hook-length control protein FliK